MKRKILICFFFFITTMAHAQKSFYQVSGKVVDPKTGKGISGVYVAFQGQYFELLFGGPEYFDDLVFDSTNQDGRFSLHIPFKIIDSFLDEHGRFFPNFRFALDIRTEPNLNAAEMYFGYHILTKMLPIGNKPSFSDRNYINHRTLILTEKNKRIKGDTTGMIIPLHKGGVVHFIMPGQDTAFMNNNFLHVVVQELDKENGEVIEEDQTNFDLTERAPKDNMLVKPYTMMNMILCKWPRHENTMDTLTIIKNVELKPGEIRDIAVPATAKKKN